MQHTPPHRHSKTYKNKLLQATDWGPITGARDVTPTLLIRREIHTKSEKTKTTVAVSCRNSYVKYVFLIDQKLQLSKSNYSRPNIRIDPSQTRRNIDFLRPDISGRVPV